MTSNTFFRQTFLDNGSRRMSNMKTLRYFWQLCYLSVTSFLQHNIKLFLSIAATRKTSVTFPMINTLLHVVAAVINSLENAFLSFSIKPAFLNQLVKFDVVLEILSELYTTYKHIIS